MSQRKRVGRTQTGRNGPPVLRAERTRVSIGRSGRDKGRKGFVNSRGAFVAFSESDARFVDKNGLTWVWVRYRDPLAPVIDRARSLVTVRKNGDDGWLPEDEPSRLADDDALPDPRHWRNERPDADAEVEVEEESVDLEEVADEEEPVHADADEAADEEREHGRRDRDDWRRRWHAMTEATTGEASARQFERDRLEDEVGALRVSLGRRPETRVSSCPKCRSKLVMGECTACTALSPLERRRPTSEEVARKAREILRVRTERSQPEYEALLCDLAEMADGMNPDGARDAEYAGWTDGDFEELLTEIGRFGPTVE